MTNVTLMTPEGYVRQIHFDKGMEGHLYAQNIIDRFKAEIEDTSQRPFAVFRRGAYCDPNVEIHMPLSTDIFFIVDMNYSRKNPINSQANSSQQTQQVQANSPQSPPIQKSASVPPLKPLFKTPKDENTLQKPPSSPIIAVEAPQRSMSINLEKLEKKAENRPHYTFKPPQRDFGHIHENKVAHPPQEPKHSTEVKENRKEPKLIANVPDELKVGSGVIETPMFILEPMQYGRFKKKQEYPFDPNHPILEGIPPFRVDPLEQRMDDIIKRNEGCSYIHLNGILVKHGNVNQSLVNNFPPITLV